MCSVSYFFLRMQALGAKLIPDLQLIPRYQEKMLKKYLKNAIYSDPKNAFQTPRKCVFSAASRLITFGACLSTKIKNLLITEWLPNVAYFDQYNLVPATQLGIVTAIIIHVTQARHVSTSFRAIFFLEVNSRTYYNQGGAQRQWENIQKLILQIDQQK